MHRWLRASILLLLASVVLAGLVSGQTKDRKDIAEKYKWNLTDIFPTDDAWLQAKNKLVADIPKIEQYKGTLGTSPQQMLQALDLYAGFLKDLFKVAVYASMMSDQDTRDSKYLAMNQEMSQVGAAFGAATSYISPEVLKMDNATVASFIKQEPKLQQYRMFLDDILRMKAHTGSEGEEKIIADASLMADAPNTFYSVFADADFPYTDVTLSDGSTVRLDKPTFNRLRPAPNREDRKKVFATFFSRLYEFRRTFGANLNAAVKSHMFTMKARNYETTLQTALDANNVPVSVYHSLLDNVNKNLPTFHRYLALRKRMLGLDTLHYYDLYTPLVGGVPLKYTVEEAEKNIVAALAPLGKDYTSTISRAFRDRWIDFYPTVGKRAGAYSQGGAYDVHPFMLLNYNEKYDDMSTLAHELGHTMQSYYSNKNQPFITANYPIFVAEVASTFNEALLIDHMLKQIKDDSTRLSLLGNYLENIKSTVFRQTQFAEFELRMHEIGEKGEALTGDKLNALYLDITRKYYGHDKNVCVVDDNIQSEWSFVPHFYYNYYVFQYATAFTASAALSEKVMAGDKAATKRYLDFLSAGGSKYPIDLLKDAGVDMNSSQPLDLVVQKMDRIMDEMEKILGRMNRK